MRDGENMVKPIFSRTGASEGHKTEKGKKEMN